MELMEGVAIITFANNPNRYDDEMEQLGELIQACLQEEGYEPVNFMETRISTSAYGGMFITLRSGKRVSLTYDFCWDHK